MKTLIKLNILILIPLAIIGFSVSAGAADQVRLAPPLVTLVPKDLGNDELWYLGGSASVPDAEIIIYLQSERGETLSFVARANEKGEWFYGHGEFLKEGKYKSWAQLRNGKTLSPPGPEVSFEILPTALRIGSYRVSYETLYFAIALTLFAILVVVSAFGIYHFRHYLAKNARLKKEIREAEEETRKGFELLRKDINDEIDSISKMKMSRELSIEEHRREAKLLADLNFIEQHILKEIGDIEPNML